MDRDRYVELQLETLRREIENCLERAFKIMVGGATLIPVLVGVLANYSATPILMTLPLVVVVTALLYLNQWTMIMRAGRYIRIKIEREIMGDDGWEAWLEATSDARLGPVNNRRVDTYLQYAFYLLTGAYYVATTYIAMTYARDAYGATTEWIAFAAYAVIGTGIGAILLRRATTNTTTELERVATPTLYHQHAPESNTDGVSLEPRTAPPVQTAGP